MIGEWRVCGCNCKRQHVNPLNTLSPTTVNLLVTATLLSSEKQQYEYPRKFHIVSM